MIRRIKLDLNTDCIERFNNEKFLVGSYQLSNSNYKTKDGESETSNTCRLGKMYSIDSNNASLLSETTMSSGILDLKVHDNDKIIMALADGSIFYKDKYLMINPKIINLSLAINRNSIAIGHDNGHVSILSHSTCLSSTPLIKVKNDTDAEIDEMSKETETDKQKEKITTLQVGNLEVWTVAYLNDSTLITGSDDASIKIWDLSSKSCTRSINYHGSGVCNLLPLDENTFISSSYDKKICIWDKRVIYGRKNGNDNNASMISNFHPKSSSSSPTREYSRNGGVWKVRQNPWNDKYLVLACMHDGFWIFDLVNGKFINHLSSDNNIAYGCDWIESDRIASCTFYNNQVQIWNAFTENQE